MEKKFIKPNWKALRKLTASLRDAYFYCWDMADNVGVYEYDPEYMKTDLGHVIAFSELLKLPEVEKIGPDKILFRDFIIVNYVQLKPGYNPHKPAFRDLEKNNLTLNSSLNQACIKLVEEDVDEEEGKDEGKDEDFGKSENLFEPVGVVPEMMQEFSAKNPDYPFDQGTDYPALLEIAGKICRWENLPGDLTLPKNTGTVKRRWGELVPFIRADQHYSGYSLTRINKHFQSIAQSFSNGRNQADRPANTGSHGKPGTSEARVEAARNY